MECACLGVVAEVREVVVGQGSVGFCVTWARTWRVLRTLEDSANNGRRKAVLIGKGLVAKVAEAWALGKGGSTTQPWSGSQKRWTLMFGMPEIEKVLCALPAGR
ncbi:hypothetical protein SVIO_102470 [Streptomyces violaceusniger]|uniref:Uncharacterized protein n=1 Tax=Streptomyces violaceusniger TaxID=68280 RepID=A0A4D4LGU1_STRVO|nr:hypothetical protein SVIO_102470 [Streptomyces violaceusniger]